MDVSFNEDAARKTGNAAQNVSLMNKIALMVIKKNTRKGSVKGKRKAAGWDEGLLCELLSMENFNASALAIYNRSNIGTEAKKHLSIHEQTTVFTLGNACTF